MPMPSRISTLLATAALTIASHGSAGAQKRELAHIGADFFADLSSLQPADTTVSALVIERDPGSVKAKASFRAVFNCVTKAPAPPRDPDTPLGRFATVHPED